MSKDINIRHNWLFPLPPPSEIGLHLVLPFFNLLPLNIIMLLVEKKIIWMKNRDYCYDDFLFVIFFDHFCCLFVSTYTTAFNNNNNNTHNLGKKIISSIIIIILYYITCWNFPWSILLLYRYRICEKSRSNESRSYCVESNALCSSPRQQRKCKKRLLFHTYTHISDRILIATHTCTCSNAERRT